MRTLLRALLWLLLAFAFVALLFTVVFPWFDRQFVNDPVLESAAPGAAVVA